MRSVKENPRVLIACEKSGVIRRAWMKRWPTHNVRSCDLLPSDDGSPFHIQGDAIKALTKDLLDGQPWDLVIAHPPCTYLCNSGVLRLYKAGKKSNGLDVDRWARMRDAAYFFDCFRRFHDGPLCIENPVMHGHGFNLLSEATQFMDRQSIQPWQFGDDASKATVLWLRGLPRLTLNPEKFYPPRIVAGKKRWGNQTDSGQNKLPPSADRGAKRAVTYCGIAKAMAEQWGCLL